MSHINFWDCPFTVFNINYKTVDTSPPKNPKFTIFYSKIIYNAMLNHLVFIVYGTSYI